MLSNAWTTTIVMHAEMKRIRRSILYGAMGLIKFRRIMYIYNRLKSKRKVGIEEY